jgi:lipopolysaccharide assembly outer membrane protein LptD (OstA)
MRTRAGWLLTLALTAALGARAAEAPQPPLNITADNMTGGREPSGDVVILNGHVRITRQRAVLTAENGRYQRALGLLDLQGNVKMVDTTTTLTCDQATFSEKDDVLRANGHVVITDRDAVLRAPRGTYDRKTGRVELMDGVEGKDGDQRLQCQSATYDRDSMVVHARGDVHGFDDAHKLELRARNVEFNRRTREAQASGAPELYSRDDHDRITVLRGTTMRVNTRTRVAEATDSVSVSRDTLNARGQFARFDDITGRGYLLGSPRVWDDQTSVSGDTLEFWSEKRVLTKVRVVGHAVMNYAGLKPGTVGEASRLSGDVAEVYFRGNQIDSLVAMGSAKNEYRGQAPPGKTAEENRAQGDTITVFFKDRKLDRALIDGKASGQYHLSVEVGDTTAAQREVVRYDAPRIEYQVPEGRIVLDQSAHLTYSDLELRARRVEYDVSQQSMTAHGNPVLEEKGDEVKGQLMTYDLPSHVGTIYQAETEYERGIYRGGTIRKAGDNTLDVLNGSYTTCDLPEPHYHFASHYMKIYLKDKLVAKPVVFYVEHVPLFALPFYVFPIKPGRHSGFLFPQTEFGVNQGSGQFIRNAGYYWAPNDYFDLTGALDYYQANPSWVIRGEGQYKVQYMLNGDMLGSIARDELYKTENWDFNAHHNQDLSPRTRLTASAEFISSRDYNSTTQYGRTLAERLNRFLTSSMAVAHAAEWASFSAILDRRQDLDADVSISDPDGLGPLQGPPPGTQASLSNLTESRPSLGVSFPTRTIGSLGPLRSSRFGRALSTLYMSFDAHFMDQLDQRGYVSGYQYFTRDTTLDSTTTIAQHVEERRGLQTNIALSDSRRAFGWLNLQPSLRSSVAIYDHDQLGNKVVPAGVWSGSMTASSTFYGTFNQRIGALEGLRHVVVPSASFNFSPEFSGLTYVDSTGRQVSRFDNFDGIGVSGVRSQFMSFSLSQRLQAKVRRAQGIERLDNLLQWNIGGSYDFLYREHFQPHPLSPLSQSVLLQPPGLIGASFGFVTDVYSPRPLRQLTGNTNLTFNSDRRRVDPTLAALPVDQTSRQRNEVLTPQFRDAWSVSLAYSYSGGYPSIEPLWKSQQTGNAVAHYQVSPGWSVDFSASYDITQKRLLTHRFAINRDLHCWSATFTRDFNPGSPPEYYFRISIKDQREVYVEHGSRTSSLGGIQ